MVVVIMVTNFFGLTIVMIYLKSTTNVIALRLPSILCPSKNNPIAVDHKIIPFIGFVYRPNRLPKIKAIPVM